MRLPNYLLAVAVGATIGFSLTPANTVFAEKSEAPPLPLEDIQTFTEIFGKIKSDYVEDVDDKTLLRYAINGMLAGLDPHSNYLEPRAFDEMRIGTEGKFGGLGIEVTTENGFVRVVTPIDDTPAYDAGIQAGDIITHLDDESVKGMSLNDVVGKMRGKPGSSIKLTIVREGEGKALTYEIERAEIKITSVKSQILEDGFGYVRITQFQVATAENLRKALSKLKKKNNDPLSGLVLDLRNNPGGILNGAVAVSDAFLREGLIVSTRGRGADSDIKFTATPNDYIDGAPLVVLVNGGSASASEIVAGALQDHKRAIIMGTRTFGKGSVQTILPMSNGAALKITTARYYTPNDRSIQAKGIVPDIEVENIAVGEANSADANRARETDLAGYLENEGNAGSVDKKKSNGLADRDFQVKEALNLLKGMSIVRRSHNA
ncbi:MAG: S41 family peptidase [Arenicellales bacterium WSBS_2016_MAG_OTU3]